MDANELKRAVDVSSAAAREAGAIINEGRGKIFAAKTKASVVDLVTEVDVKCQNVIEKRLMEAFPESAFLGEESVAPGAAASAAAIRATLEQGKEWMFIVDPLDGTANFVSSIPLSVVSIGIAYKGEVVGGVIYEPARDELFTAMKGHGAFLNGTTPLHVSPAEKMVEAVWAFGTHHTQHVARTMLRGVGALSAVCRTVRSFGSAALHLAYVAAGRLTGFTELDLSSWDVSAGSLIVMEAGGKVTDTRGEPYTLLTRDTFATNGAPEVHDGGLAALRSVDAHRPDAPDAPAAASATEAASSSSA